MADKENVIVGPWSQFDIKSLEFEEELPEPVVGQCPLEPFSDSVVVAPELAAKKVGSIHVPQKTRRRPTTGKIIVVGEDVTRVKPGDRVVYSAFAGTLFIFKKQPWYIMMKEGEVSGKLKPEADAEQETPDTTASE